MPDVNIVAMNEHLAVISKCVSVGAIAVLVLDNAGWHISPRLKLPDNIVLLPLPRYAPELNPVENVWEFLRANWLSHCVWQSYEAIRRCLLRCLEQTHEHAGRDRVDTRVLGQTNGQRIGPLVLERVFLRREVSFSHQGFVWQIKADAIGET